MRWLERPRARRQKVERARKLREHQTEAERLAWEFLRQRRCLGFKFRRQSVLQGFIVDFYCAELRLVIELDGGVHDGLAQAQLDHSRDAALELDSVRVVRIKNRDVSRERLIEAIRAASKDLG
jgi:very-short-patch-repair endonuclease